MRYLSIYRPATGEEGGMPSPEHMAAMGKLIEEMTAKGALITTEPLAPRADCAVVTLSGGQFTVSDVPERMGGYAFLNAATKEEAIEQCKAFLKVAGEGSSEIRRIVEFAPPPV